MCHTNNEKRKTTNNGRNRTTKLTKNRKVPRKENLKVLRNIGNGHHQTSGDKEKIRKEYPRRRKNSSKPNYIYHPCKTLGTILKVGEGRTLTKEAENKKKEEKKN